MLESMEQWRKQKAMEMEEQERLAAAAAAEGQGEDRAGGRRESVHDEAQTAAEDGRVLVYQDYQAKKTHHDHRHW